MNLIHILKTGHYTDMYGRHYQFSESDLNDIMQTYDPTLHEAPIVVGHPRSDGPAYGWVGGVKRGSDGLSVEPRDVEPQFAELVKTRRYSKVSACLYGPDTPGNPTPGKYYLRHVGFLGAQPTDTHWALYRIKLSQAITNDQARLMRKTLAAFAPARCELASLDFVAAPIRYNNTARYDGTYNHGSA